MNYKLVLTLAAGCLMGSQVFAQKAEVNAAEKFLAKKDYESARLAIENAVANNETANQPKTWLIRGNVYSAISRDMSAGSIRDRYPNAYEIGTHSYMRAIDLEKNEKKKKITGDVLDTVVRRFDTTLREGFSAFYHKNYGVAASRLGTIVSIYPVSPERQAFIDQRLGLYKISMGELKAIQAVATDSMGRREEAKELYRKMVDEKIKDQTIPYYRLSQIYVNEGKVDDAIGILNQGFNNLASPEQKNIMLIEKLNVYVVAGRKKDAIEAGKEAMAANPTSAAIAIVLANLYTDLNMEEEAKQTMEKAIAIDPNSFEVNYNVGINYYNKGVDLYNAGSKAKSNQAQREMEAKSKDVFRVAEKYLLQAEKNFDKAKDSKAHLRQTYRSLSAMYAQLNQMDKYNEYAQKAEKIQ